MAPQLVLVVKALGVYKCVYMHAFTTFTNTCTHTHAHTYTHIPPHVHSHAHRYMHTPTHACIHTHYKCMQCYSNNMFPCSGGCGDQWWVQHHDLAVGHHHYGGFYFFLQHKENRPYCLCCTLQRKTIWFERWGIETCVSHRIYTV